MVIVSCAKPFIFTVAFKSTIKRFMAQTSPGSHSQWSLNWTWFPTRFQLPYGILYNLPTSFEVGPTVTRAFYRK